MKLSNYIFSTLKDHGIDTVFLVTGGGAMHLNDAVGRVQGLHFICNHHEQASAMAAEGYARVTNKPAILNVTTGPGGINALNGVFGAYTDSIPMIVISGQVKRETMMGTYNIPGLRQLGDQEVDIVAMVKDITKYAVTVTEPESIRYHLEKAIYLASHGRPGPVWLDIPVDVQSAVIDEHTLSGYTPTEEQPLNASLQKDVEAVVARLKSAQRPVIIGSTGVRLANGLNAFYEAIELLGIPVTTAWTHDIIHYDHPQYVGKQGSIGDRSGNFAVQNADLALIIGSRMPIRQVSYNWENFAREAYKIHVDIDGAELKKPITKADMPLQYDAKDFLEALVSALKTTAFDKGKYSGWLLWCKERKEKYPLVLPHHKDPHKPINPYHFLHELQQQLDGNDVIVCGDATACIVTFQTSQIKPGQRLFSNSGCASMGYDLPAAIGAAVAAPEKRIICLAGDGSVQMNIQELQTLAHHRWNIKIFILDNAGYLSIKSTQQNFFGLSVGSHAGSGVSFPDMEKIGQAYGIPSFTIDQFDFQEQVKQVLQMEGPVLCNVKLDPEQLFEPKLSSKQLPDGRMVSAPLEDMFPFLSKEELESNMIIPLKAF
ncbi:thiamine pyrophosphate-binding protein [Chitinophaga pendula]|uniref:thiamine pyrophosphate-binding protein n=1 Tax=Chitinophaga TaxID=79328 RepID=UPI000BB022D0|nr:MULTISPECIES: thiamine pyrophosphate-binding protein [Chitinophaga]ASZ10111.1 acetolactate synthase [Chitinophaga sp. MD30]UCJ06935.1 thiamine pyrophosphate-binding protein [Chitinophaga pendula]